jgi:hypothetical protein
MIFRVKKAGSEPSKLIMWFWCTCKTLIFFVCATPYGGAVDWESLGTSIKQAREMHTFVTKLHHDLLPTGRRVHRYQASYYEQSCGPSCSHEDEDQAHLFQCLDSHREEWRVQFVKSIGTKCRSMRVSPNITKLLTQAIESFLFDTTFPAYDDDVLRRLRLLAEEQCAIGWHQLIRRY